MALISRLFLVPKTLARTASIIERSRYRVEIRFFYSSAGGADLLSRDFNLLDESCGRRYRLTMQAHAFDVELDGFADQLPSLLQGSAGGDATREVGDMRAIAG